LAGVPEQTVTWNTEPVEYDFSFVTADSRRRLEVPEYQDSRRNWPGAKLPLVVVEEDTTVIARALWRSLRHLQGAISAEEFASAWDMQRPGSRGKHSHSHRLYE
jgi:hypothetical protein